MRLEIVGNTAPFLYRLGIDRRVRTAGLARIRWRYRAASLEPEKRRECRLVWARDVLPDALAAPMAEAMSRGLE
ncbi:hypothetical protein ACWEGT_38970, partial [Amycolatopsis japonica]